MLNDLNVALNNFSLPVTVNYDDNYYHELSNLLERYCNYVESITNFPNEILTKIKNNCDLIFKCFQDYQNAKLDKAKERITDIISPLIDNPFIVAKLDESCAFKGAAPITNIFQTSDYKQAYQDIYKKMNSYPLSFFKGRIGIEHFSSSDMLHIPFNKRGVVATQRFSIAGVPCMYLATSSLGCWLELNMPREDLFQVSSYKLNLDIKILNLCISQDLINGIFSSTELDKAAFSLLEIFPLICATSFQVRDAHRSFKSEYIISQIVTQIANELDIQGIAYISKKMTDRAGYHFLMNLALTIPADNNQIDYPYYKLSNLIHLTKPVRFSDFLTEQNKTSPSFDKKSYCNEIYGRDSSLLKLSQQLAQARDVETQQNLIKAIKEYHLANPNDWINLHGRSVPYVETAFSAFDNYLVNQVHSKFQDK
ncbi:hypothetical protein [Sporomusa acidovorans]|uniref:RES domain-containing protein n=1 Tax=Sporomusa acidovorans (strain ATCC 49682 / DSM 3132 / Mol) TaxID=1123286 RepID=A0ABZ3IZB3_SPOA4|nr:hypothetical protein [Sporomusa acidovorans]OZC19187.1 hypothetical protein SPACI_32730 [Sporomusa acidovorans DSM 3132]SDF11388.1 hypothetical protein SAMN04488499_103331 [Sporomusa acidovorans]